jgi:hypothetical protein
MRVSVFARDCKEGGNSSPQAFANKHLPHLQEKNLGRRPTIPPSHL